MIKLLIMGFEHGEVPNINTNLILAELTPGIPQGMSPLEYYLKCKEMAKDATVILVKNNKNNFAEDEVLVLDTAYSNQTPVFCVGSTGTNSILQFMFSNWFSTVEDALDHIQVFY